MPRPLECYLYVVNWDGLVVLDLADPTIPVLVGQLPDLAIDDLVLQGDRLYAAVGGQGVAVIDVTDPTSPVLVESEPTTGRAAGLAVTGSRVLAAVPDNGLWVFDHPFPVGAPDPGLPTASRLLGAYPNPFNPRTTLTFTVGSPQPVTLTLHDLSGCRLTVLSDGWRQPGRHEIPWEDRDAMGRLLPSGTYLLRMTTPGGTAGGKISLVR